MSWNPTLAPDCPTDDAVDAIQTIVSFIGEINNIMHTIASAVEQQTATTNEISKSVAEAAGAANQVSQNVHGAADGVVVGDDLAA